MFDHFFAGGGNTFDTGYIYGGGLQERLLGRWIANRGVREDVVASSSRARTRRTATRSRSIRRS